MVRFQHTNHSWNVSSVLGGTLFFKHLLLGAQNHTWHTGALWSNASILNE